MELIIKILIGFAIFVHLYTLWFQMFSWETSGKKVFKNFPDSYFKQSKKLAANQGLYNGFLAAGLIWTFFIQNNEWQINVSLFFLSCISVAGIYGAISSGEKSLFFIQALPAIIALILIII